jgi:hypothetical protein
MLLHPRRQPMASIMSRNCLRRAGFVAGLVLWQLCAPAADTQSTGASAVVKALLDKDVVGVPDTVTLRQGETFYESPTDVHLVSANASKTAPAKILVFILKSKGAPVSRDVPPKGPP